MGAAAPNTPRRIPARNKTKAVRDAARKTAPKVDRQLLINQQAAS